MHLPRAASVEDIDPHGAELLLEDVGGRVVFGPLRLVRARARARAKAKAKARARARAGARVSLG